MRAVNTCRGGENTREIFENGLLVGYAAECPICGETNEARYDYENKLGGNYPYLIWWKNPTVGKWCVHANGAYAGESFGKPQFLFGGH